MASQFSVLPTLLFVLLMIATGIRLSECTNFTILNNCKETIWPGITANDNLTSDNGFALKPSQSAIFTAPSSWGGRIWGRTGCNFDKNNVGTCQTGSCGTTLKCFGPGQPPFSIAEFTLGQVDYYDVSLVDGFNLPVVITPVNGKGNCSVAGCESDLRSKCPPELALVSSGKTIACRSACNVFNTDEYCCRGAYSDPVSCVPTNYSKIFKQACPVAYSYAHDDPTSVLTCSTTDYIVTFCPSQNQTQCTYHDKKLVCSRSGSESGGLNSKAFFQRWWILMLPLLPILTYLPF
ncbi:pathogenesis-related protein 5-like [Camellia sinensis]|uniref:pathogenesis-related protein 5-like n=1 Tax=Camellia sinensis TaxID=4442 RepID=UPI001035D799|nr:pathogenesis-related protein 5-like [Camellia sinensis]